MFLCEGESKYKSRWGGRYISAASAATSKRPVPGLGWWGMYVTALEAAEKPSEADRNLQDTLLCSLDMDTEKRETLNELWAKFKTLNYSRAHISALPLISLCS